MAWKLFGTLSAIFAGMAARKLLVKVWSKGTGGPPPANPAARSNGVTAWSRPGFGIGAALPGVAFST